MSETNAILIVLGLTCVVVLPLLFEHCQSVALAVYAGYHALDATARNEVQSHGVDSLVHGRLLSVRQSTAKNGILDSHTINKTGWSYRIDITVTH